MTSTARAAADVKAGATATADLKLAPTKNLSAQLTNAEWLASAPAAMSRRSSCSPAIPAIPTQRIVNSQQDADEFMQVFDRMAGYYPAACRHSRSVWSARRAVIWAAERAMPWAPAMSAPLP
jgi:hypothetical protein